MLTLSQRWPSERAHVATEKPPKSAVSFTHIPSAYLVAA